MSGLGGLIPPGASYRTSEFVLSYSVLGRVFTQKAGYERNEYSPSLRLVLCDSGSNEVKRLA